MSSRKLTGKLCTKSENLRFMITIQNRIILFSADEFPMFVQAYKPVEKNPRGMTYLFLTGAFANTNHITSVYVLGNLLIDDSEGHNMIASNHVTLPTLLFLAADTNQFFQPACVAMLPHIHTRAVP